jgi:hypothetical protein
MLNNSSYVSEELFSQKGSQAKDAKFDKTLMADLSQQARQPMTVISADTAYCYDRVNHVIMSLVWLILLNRNIPAIIAVLTCPQTMVFFNEHVLANPKLFLVAQISLLT